MSSFILKGNIIHSPAAGGIAISADSYLLCVENRCRGIFSTLPEKYNALPLYDHGDKLIIPGLSDIHLHAPQYPNLGLGMDMELLDWLDTLTFPTEASFADIEFAKTAYGRFVNELTKGATTRAVIFATIHRDATLLLMDMLEKSGLRTYVGKVNMNRNSPDILCEESTQASLAETKSWLELCSGMRRSLPIITPRFVPSCTAELLSDLGALAAERDVPIQSHLSENLSEIDWVASLHPDCPSYTDVYKKYALLNNRTIMAHCVHLSEEEVDIMREARAFIAHCPASNTNLRSGIAPIRKYMNAGLNIGMGTDISGGHSLDMFDAMRGAIDASKLYWRHVDESCPALKAGEVFRLATLGGGAFFGKVGCFDENYEFDALVIDDRRIFSSRTLSVEERFERMVYLCDSRDVCAKYVAGEEITL